MQAAPGDTPPPAPAGTTADAAVPRSGLKPWHTVWILLLLGWTVSAADRAVTGPVVTWMIDNHVGFLAAAHNPHALGGLIGGLFFAGYMLTQFPGGYLGDRYGHRTLIVVSLLWAGVATLLTGLMGGLVMFIVLRVVTGLGEGAFFSNDRTLITSVTPERDRSFGVVEFAKAASSARCPLAGTLLVSNEDVQRRPGLINLDCYGEGWMVRLRPDDWAAAKAGFVSGQAALEAFAERMRLDAFDPEGNDVQALRRD